LNLLGFKEDTAPPYKMISKTPMMTAPATKAAMGPRSK
jgi:hypothetical protein